MACWRHCREKNDRDGAEAMVEFSRCNGPSVLAKEILIDTFDQFGLAGYYAMLLGQGVPHDACHQPTDAERAAGAQGVAAMDQAARNAVPVAEALAAVRAPGWKWEPSM